MTPDHSIDAVQERAALYAAGALPLESAREFEAHVRDCPVCAAEVAAFGGVADALGRSAPPLQPPPAVRERLLAAISRPAAEDAVVEQDGVRFVRAQQLPWEAGRTPSLYIRKLFTDKRRGYRTSIVRLEPGASYPPHRHADVEETYVLEGDLTVNGVDMRPGDYCRAEAGSVHRGVTTRGGCVFLALASKHDEILT